MNQEGKPSPMTSDRIRELESIDFDWGTSSYVIRYPFGAYDFNNCVNSSHNLVTVACHDRTLPMPNPSSVEVGFAAAPQLQVEQGRNAKSHDNCCFLDQTISCVNYVV